MKAGITGHQDLGNSNAELWVRRSIREAIDRYGIDHGFTCLAAGADQIFAEVLLAAGVPYTVIVPSRNYEVAFKTNEGRHSFNDLLAHADKSIELTFPQPSEQAFYAGGQEVVQRAELIIAVWNGLPSKGLGGTGDIVKFALTLGRPVLHMNPVTTSTITL